MLKKIASSIPHTLANAAFMLRHVGNAYCRDGLFTVHETPFRRDRKFQEAFRLAMKTGSFGTWEPEWRTYICCWAASIGVKLQGDFVECGTNRGGYSRAVAHYINLSAQPKRMWLLDTFQGLVDEMVTDKERQNGIAGGGYKECYDEVVRTFSDFTNVEIVRGVIPDTLDKVTAKNVCYLSIDMNCAAPEIAAAEYFWPRLSPGAPIVLDDYGWTKYAEQRKAFDEFAVRHGVPILALPTGQGVILKPAQAI